MTETNAAFNDYLTALGSGAVVLRAFLGHKPHEFESIDPRDAREYITAAGWLYGKTRFTAQQRATVEAAVANQFSISVLSMISRHISKLTNETHQWQLWRELTATKKPAAVINKVALKRVQELKDAPAPRTTSLRTTRGADGMGTLTLTAPQSHIADINHSIGDTVKDLMDANDTLTKAQARGEAFTQLLKDDGKVAETPVIPSVNINLEEHLDIMAGKGDDTQLICSNGMVITGKEYVQRMLWNKALFILISRTRGALESYEHDRFAGEKISQLAFAENPTCVAPGCCVPFDECQMHHVVAYKNGGATTITNIVPLCKYHNGKNDDDWWRKLNGHIEKRGPFAVWVSAYGFADRRNDHRLAMLGGTRKLYG